RHAGVEDQAQVGAEWDGGAVGGGAALVGGEARHARDDGGREPPAGARDLPPGGVLERLQGDRVGGQVGPGPGRLPGEVTPVDAGEEAGAASDTAEEGRRQRHGRAAVWQTPPVGSMLRPAAPAAATVRAGGFRLPAWAGFAALLLLAAVTFKPIVQNDGVGYFV